MASLRHGDRSSRGEAATGDNITSDPLCRRGGRFHLNRIRLDPSPLGCGIEHRRCSARPEADHACRLCAGVGAWDVCAISVSLTGGWIEGGKKVCSICRQKWERSEDEDGFRSSTGCHE